jgi:ABC-type transporter Mla subunit MlaD
MKSARRNVVVGLFVVVATFGLAGLALVFGQQPAFLVGGNTYPIEIQLPHAGGVRTGNIVTVNGIEIGRVTSIGLYDPERLSAEYNVRVVVAVNNKFQIPEGSTAVTAEPVFGQGRPNIRIEPGPPDAPPLPPGARIPGRVLGAVESIFPSHIITTFTNTADQIRITGEALNPVLEDLHELLAKRTPEEVDIGGKIGNLSSSMARFDMIMRDLSNYVGDRNSQEQFKLSMANVYEMTENGKQAMLNIRTAAEEARQLVADGRKTLTAADTTMQTLTSRIGDLSGRMTTTLGKADVFLDGLNAIVAPISRGEGTIGRMVKDNELYEALVLTMKRLSAMLTEYQALAKEWQKGRVKVGF